MIPSLASSSSPTPHFASHFDVGAVKNMLSSGASKLAQITLASLGLASAASAQAYFRDGDTFYRITTKKSAIPDYLPSSCWDVVDRLYKHECGITHNITQAELPANWWRLHTGCWGGISLERQATMSFNPEKEACITELFNNATAHLNEVHSIHNWGTLKILGGGLLGVGVIVFGTLVLLEYCNTPNYKTRAVPAAPVKSSPVETTQPLSSTTSSAVSRRKSTRLVATKDRA